MADTEIRPVDSLRPMTLGEMTAARQQAEHDIAERLNELADLIGVGVASVDVGSPSLRIVCKPLARYAPTDVRIVVVI